jgi:tetratricopeptide (TPR) repeat protein
MGFALSLDDQSNEAINFFDQAVRLSPRDPFNPFFFVGRAASYYLAAQYQEAIKWARQAVESRPGYLGGHRILCASLAQAGQEGETTVAMDVLRRLQPNLSISWIRQSVPYTAEPMEKFIDGMRKAGLIE